MQQTIHCDFSIIGGGVAGLWTANVLSQKGYQVLVIEPYALGHGQSIHAQGIVHGGLKYALQGQLGDDAKALEPIPGLWEDCLAGRGDVDLSATQVLTEHQLLWAPASFSGKVLGFFAAKNLASRVNKVKQTETFPILNHAEVQGHFYQLNEKVIDMPSLLANLSANIKDRIVHVDEATGIELERESQGITALHTRVNNQAVTIKAQRYIFTAGRGNANYWQDTPEMQTRPLKQVAVLHPELSACFVHCLSKGPTPRLTISAHPQANGQTVWYLGGQLAEDGLSLSDEALIAKAQAELQHFFPWIDWEHAQWACQYLERAEAKQTKGKKPASATVFKKQNAWIAWPTKMALAPVVSEQIIADIEAEGLRPSVDKVASPFDQTPMIAKPFWVQAFKTETPEKEYAC